MGNTGQFYLTHPSCVWKHLIQTVFLPPVCKNRQGSPPLNGDGRLPALNVGPPGDQGLRALDHHMAILRVRTLATCCTSSESSGPCEAGAPRITHVGKQSLRLGEPGSWGSAGLWCLMGISSPVPSLTHWAECLGPRWLMPQGQRHF